MNLFRVGLLSAIWLSAAQPVLAQELRIGFLNTSTGGLAILGTDMERGWRLGLKHLGWTKNGDPLGGLRTEVHFADDQAKPEVGVREVERFLTDRRVQIVAGVLPSNVMMAIAPIIFESKVLLVGANAGPTPLAGELCNPLFVSTSFVNDENAEATGELVSKDGVKSVVIFAPNYQSGRDNVAGFEKMYAGGRIVERIFFKLNETDFQPYFSKIAALDAEAVVVFAPGGMGISFLKQWAASGLGKKFKLYTLQSIDHTTVAAIGDAAIGSIQTSNWNPHLDLQRTKHFVREFVAQYGTEPAFFAVQGYDAAVAIDSGLKAVKGRTDDMTAVARAIRQGTLHSVRGDLKYNSNGFLIQPYWKMRIVKDSSGKIGFQGSEKIFERADAHASKCPPARRL